eukprot:6151439-Alexandrium_andersonii.AAC.1
MSLASPPSSPLDDWTARRLAYLETTELDVLATDGRVPESPPTEATNESSSGEESARQQLF